MANFWESAAPIFCSKNAGNNSFKINERFYKIDFLIAQTHRSPQKFPISSKKIPPFG
jgi:hypothetical protein